MTYVQQINNARDKFKQRISDGQQITMEPFHEFCDTISDMVLVMARELDQKNQSGWDDDPLRDK